MKKYLLCFTLIAALSACSEREPSAPKQQVLTEQTLSQQDNASAPAAKVVQNESLLPENIANYKEKYDLAQFVLVAQKTGLTQGEQKEREWNARLAAAKSNADMQAVFRDQLQYYRQVEQSLAGLEMKSEQGKQMHGKVLRGFSGTRKILEQLQKVDVTTPEGMVVSNELMAQLKPHVTDIMQGMQLFVDMLKANGLNINEAQEAKFQQKMQELKKFAQ